MNNSLISSLKDKADTCPVNIERSVVENILKDVLLGTMQLLHKALSPFPNNLMLYEIIFVLRLAESAAILASKFIKHYCNICDTYQNVSLATNNYFLIKHTEKLNGNKKAYREFKFHSRSETDPLFLPPFKNNVLKGVLRRENYNPLNFFSFYATNLLPIGQE